VATGLDLALHPLPFLLEGPKLRGPRLGDPHPLLPVALQPRLREQSALAKGNEIRMRRLSLAR